MSKEIKFHTGIKDKTQWYCWGKTKHISAAKKLLDNIGIEYTGKEFKLDDIIYYFFTIPKRTDRHLFAVSYSHLIVKQKTSVRKAKAEILEDIEVDKHWDHLLEEFDKMSLEDGWYVKKGK